MVAEKILEILTTVEVITTEVFFTDYHSSIRNINKITPEYIDNVITEREFARKERRKFVNYLNHLSRQGFIEKPKEKSWRVTDAGRAYFEKIKEKKKSFLKPITQRKTTHGKLKIVIFDIPERESKKRLWMRRSLLNLGFKMLQKSVWIGNVKLPRDFFDSLKEMNLLSDIHIFEVSKQGSINFE